MFQNYGSSVSYVVIYDIQLGSKGILPEYSRIFCKTGFV